MSGETTIVNRVASSPLVSLDLEEFYHQGERVVYDISENLYQGLILREKEFRSFVKEYDWSQFKDKNVALVCSADAIVPTWAYMLLAIKLEPYANMVVFGGLDQLEQALFQNALSQINVNEFVDKKVVVKGCSKYPVPNYAYVEITRLLRPVVSSLMFGEPCSTVPLYKRPK